MTDSDTEEYESITDQVIAEFDEKYKPNSMKSDRIKE